MDVEESEEVDAHLEATVSSRSAAEAARCSKARQSPCSVPASGIEMVILLDRDDELPVGDGASQRVERRRFPGRRASEDQNVDVLAGLDGAVATSTGVRACAVLIGDAPPKIATSMSSTQRPSGDRCAGAGRGRAGAKSIGLLPQVVRQQIQALLCRHHQHKFLLTVDPRSPTLGSRAGASVSARSRAGGRGARKPPLGRMTRELEGTLSGDDPRGRVTRWSGVNAGLCLH